MKIGLVKHLNARPLTYGFEKSGKYDLVYENPSVLKDMLLGGELDTALISSVECIRNSGVLSYSVKNGVCAAERVRSILYFKNNNEKYPPEKIYTDAGSRSSVALLKVLIRKASDFSTDTVPIPPGEILSMIKENKGSHLLFGDNALLADWDREAYTAIDMAEWWNIETSKSFCFAFWAYPKNKKVSDDLFDESLARGISHIDEIISAEKRFKPEMLESYLKKELHYKLTQSDWEGFQLFEKYCREWGIL